MDANPKEITALVIGLLICIATPISLLPQAYKLIKNRSSEGVAFTTFGIASINSFLSFLNVTILNWTFMERCQQNGYLLCFDKIIVCAQMLILFYFYMVNLCLCMFFWWFPKPKELNQYYEELEKNEPTLREKVEKVVTNLGFILLFVILFVLTAIGITLMWVFGKTSYEARLYGEITGYMATGLVFIQWTPQIIRTIVTRSSGSFSLLTLSILLPGAFGTMTYLMILSDQHFSTYMSYLCSGIQQFVLLVLCLFFDIREKCYPPTKNINEDDDLEE